MSVLLDARNLNTFYGQSHVLHDVSLSVEQGQCISLMGRNGMGKTTTVRTLFGLTPAASGTVLINGRDMTKSPPYDISQCGLALVPEGRGIFPSLSVAENLEMAARPGTDMKVRWDQPRVLDFFPRLGERLRHMGNQLSGGEQQMLAIGRALMTNPSLLVLDEATEGLAPKIRAEIWAVIAEIKSTGMAILVIDKDINALLSVSDRSIILSKGRVVFSGTSMELAENQDLQAQHLGL